MGHVISAETAQDDLLAEVKKVVITSEAMGGTVAEIAAKEIVPTYVMVVELDANLLAARNVAAPLVATAGILKVKAVEAVRLAYDMTWNYVGRPAHDAKLTLMYPGGASHYIDGEAADLPGRMELLARLYDKGIHPKLSQGQNEVFAESIRGAASAYSDAIKAAHMPAVEVELLERTRTVMARTAQTTLVNYKRHLKMAGFTEAQVHAIIPDHKQSSGKKAGSKKAFAKKATEAPAATVPAAVAPAATVTEAVASAVPAAAAPAASVVSREPAAAVVSEAAAVPEALAIPAALAGSAPVEERQTPA